ncbi:hypothetical protein YC2023_110131 [Brassica napus]
MVKEAVIWVSFAGRPGFEGWVEQFWVKFFFLASNLSNVRHGPDSRSTNHLKDKQCVDLTNKLTLQYNARLKDLLLVELKDKSKRRTLRLRQRLSWTSLSTTKNMGLGRRERRAVGRKGDWRGYCHVDQRHVFARTGQSL